VQGLVARIMTAAGFSGAHDTVLPESIKDAINDTGFFDSIPLWAVTLLGNLFITVLSFIMIMSVYGRFLKLYGSVEKQLKSRHNQSVQTLVQNIANVI
jgi:hypothetical protein